MGKIIIFLSLSVSSIFALNLEQACLGCHYQQQIPSEMIYKRYLMRYSTHSAIKKAMVKYLSVPQKSDSIMPLQFFLKFPMKAPTHLNARELEESIEAYLKHFDVQKRLRL
jgi:hypothetical protein